jgi:ribosome-binding factor A
MTKRTDRVNELVREEISTLIREEMNDPRMGGLVSITHVEVTPDLRHARAFVSVLGTDEERDSTMAALAHARPFLRRELGKRLQMKYTPDLVFVGDQSIERAQQLTDAMRQNARERGENI